MAWPCMPIFFSVFFFFFPPQLEVGGKWWMEKGKEIKCDRGRGWMEKGRDTVWKGKGRWEEREENSFNVRV